MRRNCIFHTKEFLIVTKARYGIHYVRSSAIENIQADEQTTIEQWTFYKINTSNLIYALKIVNEWLFKVNGTRVLICAKIELTGMALIALNGCQFPFKIFISKNFQNFQQVSKSWLNFNNNWHFWFDTFQNWSSTPITFSDFAVWINFEKKGHELIWKKYISFKVVAMSSSNTSALKHWVPIVFYIRC